MNIIMDYIPNNELIKLPVDNEYDNAYFHSIIIDMYIDDIAPCQIFLNDLKQSQLKVRFMGPESCGKTAIIKRLHDKETWSYLTVNQRMQHQCYETFEFKNGIEITYDILDTSGNNAFGPMHNLWINGAEFFVVVFSVLSKTSYQKVLRLIQTINMRKKGQKWGMILVANKCDSMRKHPGWYQKWGIQREVYIKQALEWQIPLLETSAWDIVNIDLLFEMIVYEYWVQSQTNCNKISQD